MHNESRPLGLRWLRSLLWPTDINRASHGERWLSAVGGFIGIYAVLWISGEVLDQQGAAMVVGSIGATLVLVFAVPHGALSQPWAVFGGHLISAVIGVSCTKLIADPFVAAALAVGLAIGAMYYLHCIHPPGGATALVAVLGGDAVHQLGYGFVVYPVLANVLVALAIASLVNFPFRHRRYPAVLSGPHSPGENTDKKSMITPQSLSYALSQFDSFIDVSEQDLIGIYALARQHALATGSDNRSVTTRATGRQAQDERTSLCLCGLRQQDGT